MSASPSCVGKNAPALGEHTRAVLEEAGLSQAEIAVLIGVREDVDQSLGRPPA